MLLIFNKLNFMTILPCLVSFLSDANISCPLCIYGSNLCQTKGSNFERANEYIMEFAIVAICAPCTRKF